VLFTREPIIETVITARSGFRLVVRNSKCAQEENLVDALEVVSFGHALFYRCNERPKAFLVPVSDYEIYEVRETRLVLKHVTPLQEVKKIKEVPAVRNEIENKDNTETSSDLVAEDNRSNILKINEKRREKRRQRRRRDPRSPLENIQDEDTSAQPETVAEGSSELRILENTQDLVVSKPKESVPNHRSMNRTPRSQPIQIVSALIPPPTTLVSDSFKNERLEYEASKLAAIEKNEKIVPVQKARTDLIVALDFYNQEAPSSDL
jgi:hypothetical protein